VFQIQNKECIDVTCLLRRCIVQRIGLVCLLGMANPAYFLQVDYTPSFGCTRFPGAIWMRNTGRVSQLAARALLVLFILVPLTALLFDRKASLAWLAWTIVSLWAALNAVQLTTTVAPSLLRRKVARPWQTRHVFRNSIGNRVLLAARIIIVARRSISN
jgi:hypothetical protein